MTISDEDDTAGYLAGNIRIRPDGSSFVLMHGGELEKVNISTPGDFSIHNALGAAGGGRGRGSAGPARRRTWRTAPVCRDGSRSCPTPWALR
ncbi:MAG: hypothetical protein V8Q30_06120 [Acutalibacteraceae bacterium]